MNGAVLLLALLLGQKASVWEEIEATPSRNSIVFAGHMGLFEHVHISDLNGENQSAGARHYGLNFLRRHRLTKSAWDVPVFCSLGAFIWENVHTPFIPRPNEWGCGMPGRNWNIHAPGIGSKGNVLGRRLAVIEALKIKRDYPGGGRPRWIREIDRNIGAKLTLVALGHLPDGQNKKDALDGQDPESRSIYRRSKLPPQLPVFAIILGLGLLSWRICHPYVGGRLVGYLVVGGGFFFLWGGLLLGFCIGL